MTDQPGQSGQRAQEAQHPQHGQYVPPDPTSQFPAQPGQEPPAAHKSFLATLLDFSFSESSAPAIPRLLYAFGVAAIVVGALSWLVLSFRASTALGVLSLIIFTPLATIIAVSFLRLVLEFFVHVGQIAEDVRAFRNGGYKE